MKATPCSLFVAALLLSAGLACGPSVTPGPTEESLASHEDELPPVRDDEQEAADPSETDLDGTVDGTDDGTEPDPIDEPAVEDGCTADGWCREQPAAGGPIADTVRFRGVHVFTAEHAIAVGDAGVIVHRDASGWSVVESGTDRDLWAAWGAADDDVWVVGGAGWPTDPNGVVLHFDGEVWSVVVDDAPGTLRAVWGASADDIWAGGAGVLMHFDGTAWSVVHESLAWDISDVWGASANDVWAVGSDGMTARFDGTSWTEISTSQPGGLTAVHGTSADDVYLLGGNGLLFRLYDGAWVSVGDYESETYFALWVSSVKGAVAVGTNAAIRRFVGAELIAEDAGTTAFLLDVMGIDDERAFAVGFGGTILRRDP